MISVNKDSHQRALLAHVALSASYTGWRAGVVPTDDEVAHIAWHCGVVEPAQIRPMLATATVPKRATETLCSEAHRAQHDALDRQLPLPHPLDYDWRYTVATRSYLGDRVAELVGGSGAVALLGVPTLVEALAGRVAQLVLFDNNAAVLAALGAIEPRSSELVLADLGSTETSARWLGAANLVVCDPPWYPGALEAFLAAAERVVEPRGLILLSVPDELVRPSAHAELVALLDLAERLGLTLESVEPRALRYRTPFFEYRAQRAAGLWQVPYEWRVGTIWQLRRGGHDGHGPTRAGTLAPRVMVPSDEVQVRESRVRIEHRPVRGPLAATVVPGDVLPTVSRRHPARSCANVWTSGNGILATSDPQQLRKVLHLVAAPAGRHARPIGDGYRHDDSAYEEARKAVARLLDEETASLSGYRALG